MRARTFFLVARFLEAGFAFTGSASSSADPAASSSTCYIQLSTLKIRCALQRHTFFVARFALGLAGSFGAAAAFLGLPFALGASSAASSSVASAFFAAAFFALGLGASSSGSESSPAETSLIALVKSSPPESDSAACAGEPQGSRDCSVH
ncbi:uncharacterized protein SCHCODRAFT_02063949 [Schizophyllum commune H4-8]|uniref:uncharacterized protein n=1 Tax=Schizophyllum commune (strain H4-8 / FGSC 9210) TaxID=578458 RepID=UPI002160249F|nr:uncharacterized protein SCHCODRAFT_02063949 [Schizophyllum commune H4-8]KAI5888841.1 hypothetical protein SCHCODRAFT_02063949 [Schizophyllum commune H4-8]